MNTDASTVEDINIPQNIERLLMSCIENSGERFSIFRNRSLTLFRNERDFRERSDSAAVSESISISMTNLLDTGLPVLVPDISPDSLTWEPHLSSMFHSEKFDELASFTSLTVLDCCDLVFTGFSDAIEASTVGSLTRHLDTKFVIGFDFAVTLSSLASSCFFFFDIALKLFMELKWLMLNKHKRWFHLSRVKLPFVSVSASQCIWFGSWGPNWFYQTTNQEQLCGFWTHVSL